MQIPTELKEGVRALVAETGLELSDDEFDAAIRSIEADPAKAQADAVALVRAVKENHAMSDTPVQVEAVGSDTIDVDWQGITVTLPAKPDDWDLEALDAFENGKAATAIRGVLGSSYDATMREFKAKHGRPVKVRDLESLMEAFASAYGFDTAGN